MTVQPGWVRWYFSLTFLFGGWHIHSKHPSSSFALSTQGFGNVDGETSPPPEWSQLWEDLAPYLMPPVRSEGRQESNLEAPQSPILRLICERLGLSGWLLEVLRYSAAMNFFGVNDQAIPLGATLRGFGAFHGLQHGLLLALWRAFDDSGVVRDGWLGVKAVPNLPFIDRPLLWSDSIWSTLLQTNSPGLNKLNAGIHPFNDGWIFGLCPSELEIELSAEDSRVILAGPKGVGKSALLSKLSEGKGINVFLSEAQEGRLLVEHSKYCFLNDALLVFEPRSEHEVTVLKTAWRQLRGRVCVELSKLGVWERELFPQPSIFEMRVGNPSERYQASRIILKKICSLGEVKRLVHRHVLSVGETLDLAHMLRVRGDRGFDAVSATLRERSGEALRGLASFEKSSNQWEDLILSVEIKSDLDAICARYDAFEALERRYPQQAQKVKRRSVALFSGPPGVGKTMAALLVADRVGLPCLKVDLGQVVSKYIGETEKRLGQIFDEGRKSDVLLLFDEADSLFSKRTNVRSSNDRYANMEVAYLLQRLEEFEGVAILTTNLARSLDEAFERRIDFHVHFDFPDKSLRSELWRRYIPKSELKHVEVEELSEKLELTGALIKRTTERAMFQAIQSEISFETEVLFELARRELSSSGALIRSYGEEGEW